MSMNLIFETKDGHVVDFPFQTPTELTYKVLNEESQELRIKLVKGQIDRWDLDEGYRDALYSEVEKLMTDPTLTLSMI